MVSRYFGAADATTYLMANEKLSPMAHLSGEQHPGIADEKPIQDSAESDAETLNYHPVEEPPVESFATLQMAPVSANEAASQNAIDAAQANVIPGPAAQVQMWLSRAAAATTFEERLVYLSQAASLAPELPTAQQRLYETLKAFLNRNPFLRYAHENPVLYHIATAEGLALAVPKDRAIAPPYPPPKPSPLRPAFRWFGLSLLGLLIAGLGTLIFAPISASLAWSASTRVTDPGQRKRARAIVVYALLLWLLALLLSGLILVHIYGYG